MLVPILYFGLALSLVSILILGLTFTLQIDKKGIYMKKIRFRYRNYKGEKSLRTVKPLGLAFDTNPHLSSPKWILHAFDVEKQQYRAFVLENIQEITEVTQDANEL